MQDTKKAEWSDAFAWRMDFLKSIVSFVIVTIITIVLFTLYLDRRQHKWEAKYGIKLETFRDFEKTSLKYSNIAYDVFQGEFDSAIQNKKELKDKWENDAYDDLIISETAVSKWFSPDDENSAQLNTLLANFRGKKRKLKLLLDQVPAYQKDGGSWNLFKDSLLMPIRSDYSEKRDEILDHCFTLLD